MTTRELWERAALAAAMEKRMFRTLGHAFNIGADERLWMPEELWRWQEASWAAARTHNAAEAGGAK